MPTYRLYEHVRTIYRYEVEADTPAAAKALFDQNDVRLRVLGEEPDAGEPEGLFSIDEVVIDDTGLREYNEVWSEELGYACHTCGAFQESGACDCPEKS